MGDEADLAEKVVYLLKNEDVRNRMCKNARDKVEDFSWEQVAEETEKVYTMLL
jgi:glycosyltransferase involved in cell wall biosynthesis